MNIVPFSFDNLPAAVASRRSMTTNEIIGNSPGGGFPTVSIKGKVFHIQRGDERTLVTKPGEDDPAGSIEVVLVRVNPNNSKVFYETGYQEGEKAKPDCYSNDGITPAADAQTPQSKKCAVCVHNQWGARITSDGRKAKVCQDSRRIAIATVDTPADPMMIRVPAGSLKNFVEYGKTLAARGIEPYTVVTRIGFDYSVAHPALTFKPVGLIAEESQLAEIERVRETSIVRQITGMTSASSAEEDDAAPAAVAAPAPAPVLSAPAKPRVTKPAADPVEAVEAAVATAATTTKARVKVEAAPASAAVATPAPAPAVASMNDELRDMIDGLDFED